ncbi:hypothetical protein [Actinoplanes sp. G11-F43]|uniref:hypothetical protein n=1 Tax=Actinoplanes sp. G11-F43 TaxID=3424130 RepID=UPI003D34C3C2
MSEQAKGRFWSGIDVPKTIAGTLAAVSAAVLGSFLGVAGTMIGAALASLISSIGTEVYHRSINHGTKRLQSAFVVAPAAVGTPSVQAGEETSPSDTPVSPTAASSSPPTTSGLPTAVGLSAKTDSSTAAGSATTPGRGIRWQRVALVAGAFFVLGMGVLTTAELFAGRSAADVTSGRENGSPTILFDTANETRDDRTGERADEDEPPVAPSETPETPAGTGATTAPADTPETGVPATNEPTPAPTRPEVTTPVEEQPETGVPEQNQNQTGDAGAATTQESE